jgi:hypothetical protein
MLTHGHASVTCARAGEDRPAADVAAATTMIRVEGA